MNEHKREGIHFRGFANYSTRTLYDLNIFVEGSELPIVTAKGNRELGQTPINLTDRTLQNMF